jgi:hypothetical protein
MLRITKFVLISDWKMWSSGSLRRVNLEAKLTIVTILMGHKCKFYVERNKTHLTKKLYKNFLFFQILVHEVKWN